MGEQTYQIKDYVHDEAVAFAGALNPKGKLAYNEDEMYSTDRYKLISDNPEDAIQTGWNPEASGFALRVSHYK